MLRAMSDVVNIHEAKTHLSRLLERVQSGEEITIAKAGRPIAKLTAIQDAAEPPRSGKRRDRHPSGLRRPAPRVRSRLRAPRRPACASAPAVRVLIDTHVFLWWSSDARRPRVRTGPASC